MSNQAELVDLFRELTELLTLEEGGPQTFRVRAYENATESIKSSRENLESMSVSALTKLDGIGKSSAQKIREYYETGSIKKLEELRKAYPREFVLLGRIPGVGPKTLLRLRDELDVHNIDDLRLALADEKIRQLKGMGAKSEEKIAKAIERLGSKQDRRPIGEALPLAEALVEEIGALPGVEKIAYAGSLRRFRETIADVDLVVACEDSAPIMGYFVAMPRVTEVLGQGDTKSSVVTNTGIQVDLRVVKLSEYGAALAYFTGSKAHNIKMRQRALERGMTLNEYGLVDLKTKKVVASETEKEIYSALELAFVPPQMREDTGEIEAADNDSLPELTSVDDLLGDLHVHTEYSGDAKSPVRDILVMARSLGYQYVAITDHGQDLSLNGVDQDAHKSIASDIAKLRDEFDDLLVLHGCELNVAKDGGLDYSADERAQFDLCLASIHSHFELSAKEQTERLLRAMEEPKVKILGHLLARSIGKRPGIELELDTVLLRAKEKGIAIEVNAGLSRLDAPAEVIRRAAELGNLFAINSDAHHADHMPGIRFGVAHSYRGWLPLNQVVNAWERERFTDWMSE